MDLSVSEASTTVMLQACLNRLLAGDGAARNELINHANNRLVVLTRKMLGFHAGLRPWEQTDDVFQNAAMRLSRALETVQPTTVLDFIGLASLQINRELIDLARHHFGRKPPQADNQGNQGRPPRRPAGPLPPLGQGSESGDQLQGGVETDDPARLAMWGEFHRCIAALPKTEREVVELLWYQDLTQQETADLLGIDRGTVRSRWQAARLKLAKVLPSGPRESEPPV
jgi:RNA polymerase sigma factor (sigma-70 family)